MAYVQTDFSEAGTFEIIPPGEYSVRIVDSQIRTGKSSGKQYIAWTLEIFNSPEPRFNNRKLWANTSFSGKGAGILKTLIEAATGNPFSGGRLDTEGLHGKEALAVVKNELLNGEPREAIKFFKPLKGASLTPDLFSEAGPAALPSDDETIPF